MSKQSGSGPPKPPAPRDTKVAVAATQIETRFSGPLPLPEILEGYNRVVPGAAERILAMAEADAKHQREMESAALTAEDAYTKRGQLLGFILAIFALSTALAALYLGSPTVAGVIGGTTVVGLVSVFVIGRLTGSSED